MFWPRAGDGPEGLSDTKSDSLYAERRRVLATSESTAQCRPSMKKVNLSTIFGARRWGSKKSKKVFGWPALWITISATSIWRKKLCSLSTTLLAQNCYLCSRYVLSPMCPGRTWKNWSGRKDLNLRPPGPEPGALARLRYAPTRHSDDPP